MFDGDDVLPLGGPPEKFVTENRTTGCNWRWKLPTSTRGRATAIMSGASAVKASGRQGAPTDVEGLPSVDLDNVHTGSETMRQLKGFDKNGDNKISADEMIDMVDEIGKKEREKRDMKAPRRFLRFAPPHAAETRRPTARRSSATATASTLAGPWAS